MLDGAPRIDPDELKRRSDAGDDLVILDVRRGSWDESDVKLTGAVRVELDDVLDRPEETVPRGKDVVSYCT